MKVIYLLFLILSTLILSLVLTDYFTREGIIISDTGTLWREGINWQFANILIGIHCAFGIIFSTNGLVKNN